MKKFWFAMTALFVLAAAACQPIAPRVTAGTASAPAFTNTPVNVPVTLDAFGAFTNPICRVRIEFEVNGDNLVVVPEGNLLVNSPIAGPDGGPSGTCFIGNDHMPPVNGNYHKAIEVDCGATPIPFGQHLGDLRISAFEDSQPNTYPVDITSATSYACNTGNPTAAATRLVDGSITLN